MLLVVYSCFKLEEEMNIYHVNKIFNEMKHLKLKFGECFDEYAATAYDLD
jgi:hypothetical protein